MSNTIETILLTVVPVIGVLIIVAGFYWYDKRVEAKELAQRGALKILATEKEVPGIKTQFPAYPTSEIDNELQRLKALARQVAEVDAENQSYGALALSSRNVIIRQRQLRVLESLGDDMERYLQEAQS